MAFGLKHLLGLEGVSREDIDTILNAADSFREVLDRPIKKVPTLRGVTVVNLFYEASTRTRISFELAAKRLSADLLNFTTSGSSVSKGETFKDTVRNIEAMKVDMIVMRHACSGAPKFLTEFSSSQVINAGDGSHEHPTQALLDMLSIRQHFGKLDGLRVVIVGDILHSRVARSNIWGLKTMGASVAICGPTTLLPVEVEKMGVDVYCDISRALDGADVVNVLRLQLERQQSGLLPSLREYTNLFGITSERKRLLNRNHIVMHPGPMNRGVEIASDVADGDDSVILDQVTNGVAVRMAVLYLIKGGGSKEDE
jgi:aspartate carbamoyltransferase catalytic subunit